MFSLEDVNHLVTTDYRLLQLLKIYVLQKLDVKKRKHDILVSENCGRNSLSTIRWIIATNRMKKYSHARHILLINDKTLTVDSAY